MRLDTGPAVELPSQAPGREIHLAPVAGGDPQDARLGEVDHPQIHHAGQGRAAKLPDEAKRGSQLWQPGWAARGERLEFLELDPGDDRQRPFSLLLRRHHRTAANRAHHVAGLVQLQPHAVVIRHAGTITLPGPNLRHRHPLGDPHLQRVRQETLHGRRLNPGGQFDIALDPQQIELEQVFARAHATPLLELAHVNDPVCPIVQLPNGE